MKNYDVDFTPLERREHDNNSSRLYVQPHIVEPSGQLKPLSHGEEVLNWQTQNARAQNRFLQGIDTKVSQILGEVNSISSQIDTLKARLQYVKEKLTNKINDLYRDLKSLIGKGDLK